MVIEVFSEEDNLKTPLVTYTIKGIDQVASSEAAKKENSTLPKITLSFELTRTGLI